MVSYAERSSAARQALLTNAEDSISMTWSAFVQALNNMQELLVKQKSSSILAARNVAYSSSISTGSGKDSDAREQNLRAREAEMARLTVRMTANHEYKEETQRRSASASRDREDNKRKFYRDKSPSNDRSKSHAGSTPGRHTNWENPATAKPQQQPTFKQPRYQYHHQANSAVARSMQMRAFAFFLQAAHWKARAQAFGRARATQPLASTVTLRAHSLCYSPHAPVPPHLRW